MPAAVPGTALEWWPVGGVGTAGADLRLPADFASVAANVDDAAAVSAIVVTDDLKRDRQGRARLRRRPRHPPVRPPVGPRQQPFMKAFADQLIGDA